MNTNDNTNHLKEIVRDRYSRIADQSKDKNASGCCGTGCACDSSDISFMAGDYTTLTGYVADADLGLGCGLPTEFALIRSGDIVVDLGSGAGNDAFVARSMTGEAGKVIGIDMTEKMIERARKNADNLGFKNVEFRLGDIEDMPLRDGIADVVVSNCVLNLVPDKAKAFAEIFRITKPGGHFSLSDIVLEGELPEHFRESAEMYAGCVSGAIQKNEYLSIIEATGFKSISIQQERKIALPDDILSGYLSLTEIEKYKAGAFGIYSVTVYAEKPSAELKKKNETCCTAGCWCS